MRPADSPSASSTTLIDDSTSHDRPFTHECARASRLTVQSARERHGTFDNLQMNVAYKSISTGGATGQVKEITASQAQRWFSHEFREE